MDRVASVEPLSTTTISSAIRRLSIALAMLRSSFSVTMVALIWVAPVFIGSRDDGNHGKAENKHNQRQNAEAHALWPDIRVVINRRMLAGEKENQRRPQPPVVRHEAHQKQHHEKGPRDPLVGSARDCVDNVTAVELADGLQIEGGREHPN